MTASRWTRLFEEGNAQMRDLLGDKGAGLAEMSRIGLPVPPGFTITTEAWRAYVGAGRRLPHDLLDEAGQGLRMLEERTGKGFGDPGNPLLLSVRSGAKFSMPGMMDSVLNLGSTPETIEGLIRATHDARFGYDCHRRFVQAFGTVVLGIGYEHFEEAAAHLKRARALGPGAELGVDDLRALVRQHRDLVKERSGQEFPDHPMRQLEMAILALFESWDNPRATAYRDHHRIPHNLGTAVNIQAMVFGNLGTDSASGVAFTRNPATGEKAVYGEFLLAAQGEDVVAGLRTPRPLPRLERELPQAYQELVRVLDLLERHCRDVRDVEFTVERGRLYVLRARAGKRTGRAAVKIAVDMAHEGLIGRDEALLRVDAGDLERILHRQVDPAAPKTVLARGVAASPGAAQGSVVFEAESAVERGRRGEKVILVRMETSPGDVRGMRVAQGVLTGRGGMTSHAAIVARGIGTPAVVGVEALHVDERARQFRVGTASLREGEVITIDGNSGAVMLGAVGLTEPGLGAELGELLRWADQVRTLRVRANADYPRDAREARERGAEGIGLCRTEHMFGEGERQAVFRDLIMAPTEEARRGLLQRLLPMQKDDFKGLFREMAGWPVIVRLLDPPLNEFLPPSAALTEEIAGLETSGQDPSRLELLLALRRRAEELREANPMLGTRGCRLGILHPEIYEMQVRAILLAAIELARDEGIAVVPEIMIPFVGHLNELRVIHEQVAGTAEQLVRESGVRIKHLFGTMIEIPRAALVADQLAELAEFFSYGTNDLTQTVLGICRDDAEARFLRTYVERGILPEDPFRVLDREGVGRLMQMGTELGRRRRPGLEVGICGEHAGDPSSVEFCHQIGLDYVSCSPLRVPIARLAAAQARLREKRSGSPESGPASPPLAGPI